MRLAEIAAPQARAEMMPMMPVVVVSGAISRRFGAVAANRVMTASQPPKAIMPTTGQDDGQEHHAALDEVGPADGHEAAQEGVDDDDAGAEQEAEK